MSSCDELCAHPLTQPIERRELSRCSIAFARVRAAQVPGLTPHPTRRPHNPEVLEHSFPVTTLKLRAGPLYVSRMDKQELYAG